METEIKILLSFSRQKDSSSVVDYTVESRCVPRIGDKIELDQAHDEMVPDAHAFDCMVTDVVWDYSGRDYDVAVFAEYQNIVL